MTVKNTSFTGPGFYHPETRFFIPYDGMYIGVTGSLEEETGNFLVTSLLLEDGTEVFPQTPEIPAGEPIELPPPRKPKKLIKKKNK